MSFLYITKNRGFAELLRNSLERSGISTHISITAKGAISYLERKPQQKIILFDWGVDQELEHLIKQVRIITDADLWFCSHGYSEKDPVILRLLQHYQLQKYIQQPFSPFDIIEELETRESSVELDISPASARIIGQIWYTRGSMRISGDAGQVVFAEGGIVREDPTGALEELLEEPFLNVQPLQISGGDRIKTGERIFSSFQITPPESWKKQRKYFHGSNLREIAKELVLSKKDLLWVNSEFLLAQFPDDTEVWKKLYALWLMGLIQVKDNPSEKALARKQKKAEQQRQKLGEQPRRISARGSKSRLLEAEYNRLKNENPYVILGLSQDSSKDLVSATLRRLKARYQAAQEQEPEAALLMLELIQKSADQILTGAVGNVELEEHERFYQVGLKAIENKDWPRADKALSKAYQLCIEDINILANLGWARFHNEEVDESKRQDEALENLQLAVQLDSSNLNALVFLSQIYKELGQPDKALAPIRKATKLTPDSQIQKLREDIEKAAEDLAKQELGE
ncbi:MAG: hypothetical protein CMK59_13540 [Proteobacteria bacterium]|nr:hypothetical protein [Pseudomonadota bacterium]